MVEEKKAVEADQKPVNVKKESSSVKNRNTTIAVAALVGFALLTCLGFGVMVAKKFASLTYYEGRRGAAIGRDFNDNDSFGMMDGFGGRMRGGRNAVVAKVTAVNGKQFTVDVSGTSKTVQISDDTRFPIESATTVKVGDTVLVYGQQDANGVIQAVQIVVNPTNQPWSL